VATFSTISNPTPFGVYNSDTEFASDADKMVVFVKRKLGDDILSVELTKKQVFANFEESTFEYGSILNQYQAKSQLVNFLGFPTGSAINPHMETGSEEKLPRDNLEFLTRFAEPYAMEAGIGGSYNMISGSIQLESGRQDYNLYTELKKENGDVLFDDTKGKLKLVEVFHVNPQAAYRFFDTTSAINYLNNEFSFESFTPETIFYVLPVFEDILRAGQLDLSNRVRRSNYSYEVAGTNIRIFPTPTTDTKKLWIKIRQYPDPLAPSYTDSTISGVSNMSNLPFGNLQYKKINSIGRQWIRQYTLALSKEQLGLIRSKFGNIPVPGAEVTLNGSDLISQGREDQKDLKTQLKEMLDTMTYDKLMEIQSTRAEQIQKQLRYVPIPNGKAIFMG
jgi:hypothetical protein